MPGILEGKLKIYCLRKVASSCGAPAFTRADSVNLAVEVDRQAPGRLSRIDIPGGNHGERGEAGHEKIVAAAQLHKVRQAAA